MRPPAYEELDDSDIWPVDHLTCRALADLAFTAAQAADYEQAAALALEAAECCQPDALTDIALQHEQAGLPVEASELAHQAAAHGAPVDLSHLAMTREEAALFEQAEHYARASAGYGLTNTLADLAVRREATGDKERAEELREAAATYGHPAALANIARSRYESHDIDGASRIAREALDQGDAAYLHHANPVWRKLWPHGIEPDGTPTPSPTTTPGHKPGTRQAAVPFANGRGASVPRRAKAVCISSSTRVNPGGIRPVGRRWPLSLERDQNPDALRGGLRPGPAPPDRSYPGLR